VASDSCSLAFLSVRGFTVQVRPTQPSRFKSFWRSILPQSPYSPDPFPPEFSIPQITSPASSGRFVGIVRLRTKVTEFVFVC
jgi:hypothetical protein